MIYKYGCHLYYFGTAGSHIIIYTSYNITKSWIKKDSNSLFDVTMVSYDGTEVRELVLLFILNVTFYGKSSAEKTSACIETADCLS